MCAFALYSQSFVLSLSMKKVKISVLRHRPPAKIESKLGSECLPAAGRDCWPSSEKALWRVESSSFAILKNQGSVLGIFSFSSPQRTGYNLEPPWTLSTLLLVCGKSTNEKKTFGQVDQWIFSFSGAVIHIVNVAWTKHIWLTLGPQPLNIHLMINNQIVSCSY